MATTITSLTNLSRFLENCKSFFSRKPTTVYSPGDYVKITIPNNTIYELSIRTSDNTCACIQLYKTDIDYNANLISGSITEAGTGNVSLAKSNTDNSVVYVNWADANIYVSVRALDGFKADVEVVETKGSTTSIPIQQYQAKNLVTSISSSSTDTQYPSAKCVYDALAADELIISGLATDMEVKSNKVTSISSSSTDTQYPSAKCVYDAIFAAMDASY